MTEINSFLEEILPHARNIAAKSNLCYHDREDVVSKTMIYFWNKVSNGEVDFSGNVSSYFLQKVRWNILDKFEENSRREKRHLEVGEFNNLDELAQQPKRDKLSKKILKRALIQVFKNKKARKKTVSDRDCRIFEATFFGDETIDSAAQKFKTSKSVIYLARHRVGKEMKKVINELGNGI